MKKVLTLILILSVLLGLLAACSDDSGTQKPISSDSFYTKGFIKGECTIKNLSQDLVTSFLGSMGAFSSKNTLKTNASLQSEMTIDLNGIKFDFLAKINYHPENSAVNTFMVEISDPVTSKTNIGFYYLMNNGKYDAYIRLNDNKISLNMGGSSFIFPMDSSFFELLEGALSSILVPIDGVIKYEYKNSSSGTQRHYYTKISLKDTLQSLIDFTERLSYNLSEYEFLFKSLLGVSINDIRSGVLPDSTIDLEFSTEGGNPDTFDAGTISSLDLKLDVKKSSNLNTVFGGKAYYANISMKSFEIKRTLLTDIVKLSDLSDFICYSTTSFSVKLGYSYPYNPATYDLLLDFFYDADNVSDTKFAYRIYNNTTKLNEMSVYLDNNKLYINALSGGKERNLVVNLDFETLLNDIISFVETRETVSFTNMLVYVMGAISISSPIQIDFKFEIEQFAAITGISAEQIITFLDNASDCDFREELTNAGLDLKVILSTTAIIKLYLDRNFIDAQPTFEFHEDLDKLN